MKRYLIVLAFILCSSLQLAAQYKPNVRIPTPEEAKIIKTTNSWHAAAVTSSICTAGFAGLATIYQIERNEAEFASKYNTDKVIVYTACLLAGTSAFVATISWGEYSKFKHRLPKNKIILKTSPTGLIVEF